MIWGFCVYFVYMIPLETDVLRKHRFQKEIRMHIAKRKELDVHKSKRKRCRNRTTTSLVLDSSMQRGILEFRLNQRIWLRLLSVFASRRISFIKIFLVIFEVNV